MATRQILNGLAERWRANGEAPLAVESVGGVDAARRVRDGEAFDLVFLASDALARLADAGRLLPASAVDLMRSEVAIAVRSGRPHPAIDSEAAVRAAVLAAPSLGYSTGPSGVALQKQFEAWGIADAVRDKTREAPPGIPVAALIARGEVALGFQQLSELQDMAGVDVVGLLPDPIRVTTVFSGAIVAGSAHVDEARRLLQFMTSPDNIPLLQRYGMMPVSPATSFPTS